MDKNNCRYYARGGGGTNTYLAEPNIWIAVKDEYAYMLSDDVYDAFVLVPLYLGMYYKEDIHIHGCVSKKLYKNVMTYLQRILCDFSDDLSRINITVDGFKTADGDPNIIGAGLSCGVDSFTTIYDHYVNEDDPEYRINGLFFYNCGWHGDYYDEHTMKLCMDIYHLNKPAADEIHLPLCMVNSNLHAFVYKVYPFGGAVPHMGYLANYSCILSLQRAVKKYYVASGRSYEIIKRFSPDAHDHDLSGFTDSYLVPLIRTEKIELVIDGCQYDRSQKVEHIADWDIAHKYLSPCDAVVAKKEGEHNCSMCHKCLRTLLVLEALGKLNDFAGVFDIETYKKYSFMNKCDVVLNRNKKAHHHDNYTFAISHGLKMPSPFTAWLYLFSRKAIGFTKKAVRKIIGNRFYNYLKRTLKHS